MLELGNLHLAELLDFRPEQGIIRLHEQRVVILSAVAWLLGACATPAPTPRAG